MRRLFAGMMIVLMLVIGFPAPKARACGYMVCEGTVPWLFATGSAITSFTLALVSELYSNFQNGMSVFNAQIAANSESFTETMHYQIQTTAEINRTLEANRVAESRQVPPTYKPQATATSAAAGASLQTDLARASIQNQNFLFTRNMDKMTAGSGSANAIALVNNHLTKYCGELEHSMGLCEKDTQKPRLIDADIRASTIFSEDTIEKDLETAAVDFTRNVAGAPPPKPGKNDIRVAAGIQKVRDRNVRDSRALLAHDTMDWLVAFRTEIPDDQLKDWAKNMVKRLTGGVGMAASYNGYYFGQPCGGGAGFLDLVLPGDVCKPFKAGMIIYSGQGSADQPITQAQADVYNVYYSTMKAQGFSTQAAITWTLHIHPELLRNTSCLTTNCTDWINDIGCMGLGQWCGIPGYSNIDAMGIYLVQATSNGPGVTNPKTGKLFKACELVPNFVISPAQGSISAMNGCGGNIFETAQNNALGMAGMLKIYPEFKTMYRLSIDPNVGSSELNRQSTERVLRFGNKGSSEMEARISGFNRTFAENKAAFEAGAADCTGKENGSTVAQGEPNNNPPPATPSQTPTSPANTPAKPEVKEPVPASPPPPPTASPQTQPAMTGKYIVMRPSGKKDQFGGELYDLSFMDGQTIKATVQIVSGRPGKTKDHQNQPSEGPLPGGKYSIGAVNKGSHACDIGNIWIPLTPQPGNDMFGRSDFGIHRDNDRTNTYPGTKCVSPYSPKPGTQGCVGTLDQSGIETVAGWVNAGAKTLVVDYGNTAGASGQNCTGEQNPKYELFTGGLPTKQGLNDAKRHWEGTGGYCAVSYSGPPDRNGNPHCVLSLGVALDLVGKLNGQALNAPTPSPVDGVVIRYNYLDVAGNNILIKATTGQTVKILHFNKLVPGLKVGDPVKFGQNVGYEGMTGGTSTGVHWHIEASAEILNRWIKALVSGVWDGACLTGDSGGGSYSSSCSSPTADLGVNELSDRTSHAELIKIISTYRFMDPEWIGFVTQSASPYQLLRDIATMHSISLYNDWQRYELKQKVAAMVAAEGTTDEDILKLIRDN